MPINVGFCNRVHISLLSTGSVLFLLVCSLYSDFDSYPSKYVENPDRDTKGCCRGKFIKICEKTGVLRRSGEYVIAVEII